MLARHANTAEDNSISLAKYGRVGLCADRFFLQDAQGMLVDCVSSMFCGDAPSKVMADLPRLLLR